MDASDMIDLAAPEVGPGSPSVRAIETARVVGTAAFAMGYARGTSGRARIAS